jgi:hypothetical protein
MPIQQMLLGAGAKKKEKYIDDYFKSITWHGANSSTVVNTGVNITSSGSDGGAIFVKNRTSNSTGWVVQDSVRGFGSSNRSAFNSSASDTNGTNASSTNNEGYISGVDANNTDVGPGRFTVTADLTSSNSYDWRKVAKTGEKYVGTVFAKCENFFDIVEYSGDSSTNKSVAHSLGVAPASMWIKRTDVNSEWIWWHKDMPNDASGFTTLTSNNNDSTDANCFTTLPDANNFYVNSNYGVTNTAGGAYICYLFADHSSSNRGNFGGYTDNYGDVIKCGTFTNEAWVDLGFVPQWVMLKCIDADPADAEVYTSATRFAADSSHTRYQLMNTDNAEQSLARFKYWGPNISNDQMGFYSGGSGINAGKWIYIAVRKPDGYVGKLAGQVDRNEAVWNYNYFNFRNSSNNNTTSPNFYSDFPVTMGFYKAKNSNDDAHFGIRLYSGKEFDPSSGSSGSTEQETIVFDSHQSTGWAGNSIATQTNSWMWGEWRGFDCEVYRGDGQSAGNDIYHMLNSEARMIWVKSLDRDGNWQVYIKPTSGTGYSHGRFEINSTNAEGSQWQNGYIMGTGNTHISVGGGDASNNQKYVNQNNYHYMCLAWSDVPGYQKIGSYTSSSPTIDLGFTPRLMMFRKFSGSNWYVIYNVSGNPLTFGSNDYYFFLDTDAQPSTANGLGAFTGTSLTLYSTLASGDWAYYAVK